MSLSRIEERQLAALVFRAFDGRGTPAFARHVEAIERWAWTRGIDPDELDAEIERVEHRRRWLDELRRRDLRDLHELLDRTDPDRDGERRAAA